MSTLLPQEVYGNMTEHREDLRPFVFTNPAGIFMKGDVEDPMQGILIRLSRFKLAGPPTPRDTEVSNAYAIIHDSRGPVCICSLIGINSNGEPGLVLLQNTL